MTRIETLIVKGGCATGTANSTGRTDLFFCNAKIKKYTPFLADSRTTKEQKEWEKLLYMMDSILSTY